MKNLLPLNTRSLLACTILLYSFGVFANVETRDQISPNVCAAHDRSTEQCIHFVRGYLDAMLQLNEVGFNSHFSKLEQRAFNNRVGKTKLPELIKKELNLCLPKDVNAREILANIDKELPLQDALLKALKVKYPC
jgi:hypothetical protein